MSRNSNNNNNFSAVQLGGVGNNFTTKPKGRNNGPSPSNLPASVNDVIQQLGKVEISLTNIRKRELNDIFLKNSNINGTNRLINYKKYDALANKILELIQKISIKFDRFSNIAKPIYDIYTKTTNGQFIPPSANINNYLLGSINKHANNSKKSDYKKASRTLRRIRELLQEFRRKNITNSNKIKVFMNYTHPSKNRTIKKKGKKIYYDPNINKRIDKLLSLHNSTNNLFLTKIINTLYEVISETVSNLHMMKEHIKKLFNSKSNNFKYNHNGLKRLKMNLKGKKTVVITLDEKNTKIFLKRMFYDMVHDGSISNKDDFIEILKVFIKGNFNTNSLKQYLKDLPDTKLKSTDADKKIKDENKNRSNGYCYRAISVANPVTRNKQLLSKLDLIKFMRADGSKKYKKFDVLIDTDSKAALTQSIFKLSQTTQSGIGKGSILITPSTLLDPGSIHMAREGFNPLVSMANAFISKNNGYEHLFRLNGKMYDTQLNFHGLGTTKLGYNYNPSRGYQLILNENKTLNFGITKKQAQATNVNNKISKFLGDFMIIMNTIGINKDPKATRPTAFSTTDNSAALIYIFMSKLAGVKPRLIFTTARARESDMCIYGMNDIIIGNRGNRRTSSNMLNNIRNTNLGNASNTNN